MNNVFIQVDSLSCQNETCQFCYGFTRRFDTDIRITFPIKIDS